MKKRSLVASIAMLLVSAIVLSTSTYAWFSAGATVTVDDITATITKTDGTIEISADSSNWGATIDLDDLKAVSGNALNYTGEGTATKVSNLATVSGNPGANGTMSFIPASLTATGETNTIKSNATATGVDSGNFVYYKFYIAKTGDYAGNIKITPKYTLGEGDKKFVIGAVAVGNTIKYYGAEGVEYYPLKAGQTVNEAAAAKDCIITPADGVTAGGSEIGDKIQCSGGAFENITPGTEASPTEVRVWIWAEGQEATCTGSVTGLQGKFSFSVETTA